MAKEIADVKAALEADGSYLGMSDVQLRRYAEQLAEKEKLLAQLAQVQDLRPAPPGPAATFDRTSLISVLQHMLLSLKAMRFTHLFCLTFWRLERFMAYPASLSLRGATNQG